MNRLFTKRLGALMSSLLIISSVSFSQFDNFDFLKSVPADGVKFLQAYISPYTNAFGAGLNGGWYNSAKPHKLLGFDLTLSVNAGIVPSSENTFDVTKIGLTKLTGTGMASTIAGPNKNGPVMTYKDNASGVTLASFTAPPGTEWKYVPTPTVQLGLGLPFGTEVKFRFIPKIDLGGKGDISLFGVGVMHSLLQYLPGYKMMKLWDVSFFGGYTKLQGNAGIDLQPDWAKAHYSTNYPTTAFQNQNLSASFAAMNVGLVGSINIPVLTLYGGVGYCSTKTDIKLTGNFPTPTYNAAYSPPDVYEDAGVIKNFPAIEIKNSGVRANIGLRIKLAIITIHADYTLAQYNMLSTGLGISFR
ncbi:MAG: hypothetical protein Q8N38_00060 [Bacteroidales bacterium]|nr:hypothetical protein [Bacteroidales bacterium]